ncbi:MAG: hypothetical protein WBD46_05475 [Acidobacteriaceae bacterium]
MIPWTAWVRVHWNLGTPREHRLGLWIPLFLVWLILLPLMLVLFPLIALVCVFIGVDGVELYRTAWRIVSSLRRTCVEVKTGEFWVWVSLA